MTKPEKRAAARELRRTEGLTLKEIAERLGVAKSSVSLWVRDIVLTEKQQIAIHEKHYMYENRAAGSKAVKVKYRELRLQYQQAGREKAREGDPLHLAGCMLYWAEGAKARNSLTLVNSDVDMLVFYMRFLRESMSINDSDIAVRLNFYDNNGLSPDEIIQYWLEALNLPESCLRKIHVNKQPKSSQQKNGKLIYGVCEIAVHKTEMIQHVYGAIQEYTGIDKPEWLM